MQKNKYYTDIVILGAAGLAKEFYYYIKRACPTIRNFIFVNDLDDGQHEIYVDNKKFKVIKDWKFDKKYHFCVAVGNPKIKEILVKKALESGLEPAETFIDPSVLIIGSDNEIGFGGVIAPYTIITTNVKIGNFVTLNLCTTVGHDTVIGDYVTTNPGVHISGQCCVGDMNEFGSGSVLRDRLLIGSNKKFGAQSAIVKSIEGDNEETYVGVPSKVLVKRTNSSV